MSVKIQLNPYPISIPQRYSQALPMTLDSGIGDLDRLVFEVSGQSA